MCDDLKSMERVITDKERSHKLASIMLLVHITDYLIKFGAVTNIIQELMCNYVILRRELQYHLTRDRILIVIRVQTQL